MATKLIRCPEYKETITELNAVSSVISSLRLIRGKPDYQGLDYCEGYDAYECPECHERVAMTEAQAIKILKGV